ncbi:tetratricopeptide repeat protein [bacterium]|nr:tetratricopeptide repeat protein [bacterium]MBU1983269.1 tetratricopeptide repeat protein [bacterium]
MSLAELFLLLATIMAGAGGAYYYLQRRDRVRTTPVSPYAEGLRAALDGDHLRAIQKLREVVSADSSNVDAYLRLGVLFAEIGDVPRAIKIHKSLTFRSDFTLAQKIAVYRNLAEDYLKAADVPAALEAIERVLSFAKKDRWALEKKLQLLVSQKDWDHAYDTAEKLAALGGDVSQRFLAALKVQEGLRFCENKKERDGRIRFREAIKHDSTMIAPYLYWGDSYIRENRTEDAVRIWRRLLNVNPAQSHLVFERLESRLFDLGRFSEIEQIYRALIRSYPQNVHAYAALARFLDKRGDRADAVAVLHDGVHQNPDSLWLRRLLIQLYGEVRDMDRVLQIAREILARVMKEQYEFTCSSCGNVSTEPLWLCPRCNKLDTYHV